MKNLLVLTDFSPESHHAFAVALQLARRIEASVTLLHVVEVPATADIATHTEPTRRMDELMGEAARTAPCVPVRNLVLAADPDAAVLQVIEEQQIDLVVIGAQIHPAMENLPEGSHTEQLVRLAPCPVLTVKYAVADFAPRRILFASDFTAEADQAVPGLQQVQALFPDAELHLLQVVEREDQGADAKETIGAFVQRHGLLRARVGVFVDDSPATGIPLYARQVQADLLVVPTHGRTGLPRLLQTSIAENVATHAFPPVLTFRLA